MRHTLAIVLKKRDVVRNVDRLFTFYTENMGKIECLASGVKKMTSKLAGSLEPLSVVDLTIAKGKRWDRIVGSSILENFPAMKSRWEAVILASYLNQVVDWWSRPHESARGVFLLLVDCYRILERLYANEGRAEPSLRAYLILLAFLLRLVSLEGFQPDFVHCYRCGKKVCEEKNYFSFHEGRMVCPNCTTGVLDLETLSPLVLKILRRMIRKDFPFLHLTGVSSTLLHHLESFMIRLLERVSERSVPRPVISFYSLSPSTSQLCSKGLHSFCSR